MGKKDKKNKDAQPAMQEQAYYDQSFGQPMQQFGGLQQFAIEQQMKILEEQNEALRQDLIRTQSTLNGIGGGQTMQAMQYLPQAEPKKRNIKVSYSLLNNNCPVPVAKPADFIQLTPIVQPIPLVPFSTTSQELLHNDDYYN